MSDNENRAAPRKPDNITTMSAGGTTYEIREFFNGKKTIEEIITQRILQETMTNPIFPDPQTS